MDKETKKLILVIGALVLIIVGVFWGIKGSFNDTEYIVTIADKEKITEHQSNSKGRYKTS